MPRAALDPLESRRHLAVAHYDGVVEITGTPGDDVYVVTRDARTLVVRENGVEHRFPAAGIYHVYAHLDAGDDRIDLSGVEDVLAFLAGDEGDDTIVGGAGGTLPGFEGRLAARDVIEGGPGDDSVVAGPGDDSITTGPGNDTVRAGDGDDRVDAGEGNDHVHGDAGADRINGRSGKDRVYGGPGDDVLYGDGGHDLVHGDSGADRLLGGLGDDQLLGGPGSDRLSGEAGNDRLDGGAGRNTLDGGDDTDRATRRNEDRIVRGIELLT